MVPVPQRQKYKSDLHESESGNDKFYSALSGISVTHPDTSLPLPPCISYSETRFPGSKFQQEAGKASQEAGQAGRGGKAPRHLAVPTVRTDRTVLAGDSGKAGNVLQHKHQEEESALKEHKEVEEVWDYRSSSCV